MANVYLERGDWDSFHTNRWVPAARKVTHSLSVLTRYINKHKPLSGDSVDALGPQLADIRIQLQEIDSLIEIIEEKRV